MKLCLPYAVYSSGTDLHKLRSSLALFFQFLEGGRGDGGEGRRLPTLFLC